MNVIQKIKRGLAPIIGQTILHTAPHHDDIVLGYYAYAIRNFASNRNHILYMTNGSNGVSNAYLLQLLKNIHDNSLWYYQVDLFAIDYQTSIRDFAQAYKAGDEQQMEQSRQAIFLQIIIDVFRLQTLEQLRHAIDWVSDYCANNHRTQQADDQLIIRLKGRVRQSESDCKWMISKASVDGVRHFDAQFYYDDTAAALQQDVCNFVTYLHQVQPDVITVAMDPCGVGPQSHFATLQVIAQALQLYNNPDIKIIGYRNVWSSFLLERASILVPVTEQEIMTMQSIFIHCFASQHAPLRPSPMHEGLFSDAAALLQRHNFYDLQEIVAAHHGADGNVLDGYAGLILLQEYSMRDLMPVVQLSDHAM